MKLAIALFFAGLLSFFLTDYFILVGSAHRLVANQTNDPGVQAYIAELNDLQDGTTAPIEERIFTNCGYVNEVRVKPGFRIVHDLTLGDEVVVKGPKNALSHLELHNTQGRLSPDFNRPVKLNELVTIRVNLQAHGSEIMRIGLDEAQPGRTRFQPDFVTKAPLSFQVLTLGDIPKHPIQIEGQDLIIYNTGEDDPSFLEGKVNRLEFIYSNSSNDSIPSRASAPNLRAVETMHYNQNS